MKVFFRQHYLAIILAFLVGMAVVLPQLLFIHQAGSQYAGFNIFETDGEYYYDARVREVYDGHYRIANPLMSGKDLPYTYPPVPEFLMGAVGRGLHLSLDQVLILFRFVAPAGLFLLIYFFVLRLRPGGKLPALLATTFILLASNIVSYPQEFLQMIRGTFTAQQFTDFARPVNPQFSSFIFFGFLYALWRLFETNRKVYFYWCLALFALSFYVYLYSWTFLAVVLGIQAAVALWRKNRELFQKTLLVLGGGFILAIPYFLNLYQMVRHSAYPDLIMQTGLYESHQFVFSRISLLAAGLLILLYYFLKNGENKALFWFFGGLVLAGVVVVNQQVITGRVMQYGHYHWYFNRPVLILLGAIVFFEVLRRIRLKIFYQSIVATGLIAVAFFNVFEVQAASYLYHFSTYFELQQYKPVIEWLDNHGQTDQVVYIPQSYPYSISDDKSAGAKSRLLNQMIPMYTPLNVYYDPKASLSLQPHKGYDRYNLLLTLKLLNVAPEMAVAYLWADPRMLVTIYGVYFKIRGQSVADIPEEQLLDIQKDYQEFFQKSWTEILGKYPLDYIVWDQMDLLDLPLAEIAEETGYQYAYDSGGVVIYRKIGR